MASCIAQVELELTVRSWFWVLNSHQGQPSYQGFSCRAGHTKRKISKIRGFYQMQDCTDRNSVVHRARR